MRDDPINLVGIYSLLKLNGFADCVNLIKNDLLKRH